MKIINTEHFKAFKYKPIMVGPDLPLIHVLFVVEYSEKGCTNLYNKMCKSNYVLISDIQNKRVNKLNLEMNLVTTQNTFKTSTCIQINSII